MHAPYENSFAPNFFAIQKNQTNTEIKSNFMEQMHAETDPINEFQSNNSDWVHWTEIGISMTSIRCIFFQKQNL